LRAAIYFTPPAGAPLARAAAEWLGRDAFLGTATRSAHPAIDPLVVEPARYGFHATMRAPFTLAEGIDLTDLDERLARFAASRQVVRLPAIRLAQLGRFFALVPAGPSAGLADLEADTVRTFEPFRRPSTAAEIAKRRPQDLSERQRGHLEAFGYPYVFEDFRFHMTLTGPVDAAQTEGVHALLTERFAAFDGAALSVDGLALFIEPAPGQPFRVHSLHSFDAS
jgi:putative phosphonate metabolism protein